MSRTATVLLCSFFLPVSLFSPFHRNTFGVVCRILCFTIVPVTVSALILAGISASAPFAPTGIAALRRGLVFVRGWCPSFVVPRCLRRARCHACSGTSRRRDETCRSKKPLTSSSVSHLTHRFHHTATRGRTCHSRQHETISCSVKSLHPASSNEPEQMLLDPSPFFFFGRFVHGFRACLSETCLVHSDCRYHRAGLSSFSDRYFCHIVALHHLPNIVTDILWSIKFLIKGVHASIDFLRQAL